MCCVDAASMITLGGTTLPVCSFVVQTKHSGPETRSDRPDEALGDLISCKPTHAGHFVGCQVPSMRYDVPGSVLGAEVRVSSGHALSHV